MKRRIFLCILLVVVSGLPAFGGELQVTEGVIATRLSDRAPADAGQSFPALAEKLYCFTAVSGAAVETIVTPVWYWEGKEIARVELPVRSSNWRTWSSKKLIPEWTGKWQEKIVDDKGIVLLTIPFTVI